MKAALDLEVNKSMKLLLHIHRLGNKLNPVRPLAQGFTMRFFGAGLALRAACKNAAINLMRL